MLSRSGAAGGMWSQRLRRYAPVIAAFAVSRLVIIAAAVLVEAGAFVDNPRLTHGDPAPILRSLTTWDGDWFVGIARNGYHVEAFGDTGYHDYAFFPLYPMLVRVLALPWPHLVGPLAVVLNAVLFAIALVLLVRLARRHLGEARAIRAAALLALFPFSYVYTMAYSETLTLALIVASFLAVERGYAGRAGVFFGLASLTRAQGAFYPDPAAHGVSPARAQPLAMAGTRARPARHGGLYRLGGVLHGLAERLLRVIRRLGSQHRRSGRRLGVRR